MVVTLFMYVLLKIYIYPCTLRPACSTAPAKLNRSGTPTLIFSADGNKNARAEPFIVYVNSTTHEMFCAKNIVATESNGNNNCERKKKNVNKIIAL